MSPPNAGDGAGETRWSPAPELTERFVRDCRRLFDPDRERVMVAVSGGADSVALLLLMRAAIGERCVAATVDHKVRPAAAREAAWVAELCGALGVAHSILTLPAPTLSADDRADAIAPGNLSDRLRQRRYAALGAATEAAGADRLATAHHADDQLETMVMRLNRGSGVGGLAAIRAANGRTVRPLLGWRRAELAAIAARAGLSCIDDPTNRDDRYDRARLRKALAGVDWLDPLRWNRSAQALGQAEEAIGWAVRRRLAEACVERAGEVTLGLADDDPPEILRRMVAHCLARIDPAIAPRGDRIDRLIATILAARDLPPGRRPRATLGRVLVEARFDTETGLKAHFRPAPPRSAG